MAKANADDEMRKLNANVNRVYNNIIYALTDWQESVEGISSSLRVKLEAMMMSDLGHFADYIDQCRGIFRNKVMNLRNELNRKFEQRDNMTARINALSDEVKR